ncbi:MAG TPA: helix-turn-helix domain-containing protein [Solirubrobacterales bacterium]|jgi:AcrR family transcriptional regulator|nr:helix-turn-helix domain-containing protein [Solirubrobacterales bacterium]
MVVATQPQRRRDASANRVAILEAARELLADSTDVAMCTIAKRAGVGQATLYRNFPNRSALAVEIIDEYFERIAALASEHQGDVDAFFILLRSMIDGLVSMYALAVLARSDAETDSHLQRARQRMRALLKGPLGDAKAAGVVRRDLSIDDVFLMLAMGRGAMEGLPDSAARSAVAHRVLALLLNGVEAPRPA